MDEHKTICSEAKGCHLEIDAFGYRWVSSDPEQQVEFPRGAVLWDFTSELGQESFLPEAPGLTEPGLHGCLVYRLAQTQQIYYEGNLVKMVDVVQSQTEPLEVKIFGHNVAERQNKKGQTVLEARTDTRPEIDDR